MTKELNLLARLAGEQTEAELREKSEAHREQRAEHAQFEAYCYRRLERFEAWALRQDHADLAKHFAFAVLLAIERKKLEIIRRKSLDFASESQRYLELETKVAKRVATGYAERYVKTRSDRRRGADKTNARVLAAKNKVRELWDKTSEREKVRRGAPGRFATLTAPKVESTTVEGITRWVRQWQKESCKR